MIIKLACSGDCKQDTAAAARLKVMLRERRELIAAGRGSEALPVPEILKRAREQSEFAGVDSAGVSCDAQ